jgi:hypothetical protein
MRDAEHDAVVAIHRRTFAPEYFAGLSPEDARSKYNQMAQTVRSYLSEMGLSDQLFAQMMSVRSSDVRILSIREMVDLGLSGIDPAYEERKRAEEITEFGADYVRRVDEYEARMRRYGERCMAFGKSQWTCMEEYMKNVEPWPKKTDEKFDPGKYGTPVR